MPMFTLEESPAAAKKYPVDDSYTMPLVHLRALEKEIRASSIKTSLLGTTAWGLGDFTGFVDNVYENAEVQVEFEDKLSEADEALLVVLLSEHDPTPPITQFSGRFCNSLSPKRAGIPYTLFVPFASPIAGVIAVRILDEVNSNCSSLSVVKSIDTGFIIAAEAANDKDPMTLDFAWEADQK